ncbi:MAG: hypothetical protein PSV46_19530 [Reyranella sp.]|nr:hypothetical protein [Reyranella sp.]
MNIKTAIATLLLVSIAPVPAPLAQTPSTPGSISTPSPPAPGIDEGVAKTKLQADGYSDIRGLTANPDGSWSGKAMRDRSELSVTVDSAGNIKTR